MLEKYKYPFICDYFIEKKILIFISVFLNIFKSFTFFMYEL